MTKPTGKKRGRPRKVPDFIARLGENQDKWDQWLSAMELPAHSSSKKEVLEHRLPDVLDDGNTVRPIVGNRLGDESLTQPSDSWYAMFKDDKDVPLPLKWRRYLEYMDVIAEARFPNGNGSLLKEKFLKQARFRMWGDPPEIPSDFGTPAEFRAAFARSELKIHIDSEGRQHVIRIRSNSDPVE